MKKIVFGLLFVMLPACSSNYSKGYRIGMVRKFSKKGVFIKSWEGELLLGGVVSTTGKNPELVNETFGFSVDPEAQHNEDLEKVVAELDKAAESGKRTKLYYNQDTWPKIRTDTNHLIYKAEILEN